MRRALGKARKHFDQAVPGSLMPMTCWVDRTRRAGLYKMQPTVATARYPGSCPNAVAARLPCSSMSSELESVNLPAELLDQARDAASLGEVGSVADYVADAVRLRLAKDRALAQVAQLFGGPPPEDVLTTVRQRAGLPPRRAAS